MKNIFKNKWLWLLILLVGVGFWRWKAGADKSKDGEKERVVTVERQDVTLSLTISGRIRAEKQAVLNFPISGKLAYINAVEGVEVRKGQVLASLDLGDLESAQTKAYYAYLAADAYAKKIEDEVKGHDADETFTQKYSRVSAQTARDSAYDTWLSAKRAVENARLVSPLTGIVTAVTVNAVGDTVSIGDGVSVVDPKTLYFEGEVDETDVGKMTNNPVIQLTMDAFEGEIFSGRLESIGFSSRISSTGATVYPVKIRIQDIMDKALRLDMNGDARIVLAEAKQVLALPIDAVIDGKVYKKEDGSKLVPVETGLEGDVFTEIRSGLSEGDQVLIK